MSAQRKTEIAFATENSVKPTPSKLRYTVYSMTASRILRVRRPEISRRLRPQVQQETMSRRARLRTRRPRRLEPQVALDLMELHVKMHELAYGTDMTDYLCVVWWQSSSSVCVQSWSVRAACSRDVEWSSPPRDVKYRGAESALPLPLRRVR